MKNKNNSQGFTLLELLVVIAIIGTLAGIVLLAMQNARIRGRDAKRMGDMRQVATSMQQYYISHGVYPTGSTSISGSALDNAGTFDGSAEPMVPNYLPIIPQAPNPADGSCSGGTGKGSNNYWYETNMAGDYFTLTFCLGKDVSDTPSGTRTLTPNGLQ